SSYVLCSCTDAAAADICPLCLHDALPISKRVGSAAGGGGRPRLARWASSLRRCAGSPPSTQVITASIGSVIVVAIFRSGLKTRRSEEHTSELQSRENLVCRLLLEK